MSTVYLSHSDCLLHDMSAWHAKAPAWQQALEYQLIASKLSGRIARRDAPLAAVDNIRRVHLEALLERTRANLPASSDTGYFALDADTLINAYSGRAALRAAGAAVAATDAVIAGESSSACCAGRPPGHQATPDASMGFCLTSLVHQARLGQDVRGRGVARLEYALPLLWQLRHVHPVVPRSHERRAQESRGVHGKSRPRH